MQFPIMPFRLSELEAVIAGYEKTGVPLIAIHGGSLRPAGFSDDPGLYAVVPWVARVAGLDAAAAVSVFVIALLGAAFVIGATGLLLLCRGHFARAFAVMAALCVAVVGLYVGDVYAVAPAIVLAIVPWFLVVWRRAPVSVLTGFLILGGVAMGWAHWMRSHSATGVLLFIAVILAVDGWPARRRSRAIAGAGLLLGLVAAGLWTRALVHQRDAYLAAAAPGYVAPEPRHPFWHSVYIGLGFTDNPHVSEYRDEIAMARVATLAPAAGFLSPRYEAVLRAEVLRIARENPLFFAQNIFAKLGVVVFFLLLFANLGLLAAAVHPLPRPLALAFAAGIAFSSLFGLLVVPLLPYLSGFAAFAALFCILAVDEALTRRAASDPVRTGVRPRGEPR